MPNDRRIRENILTPTGVVVPPGEYIWNLDQSGEASFKRHHWYR